MPAVHTSGPHSVRDGADQCKPLPRIIGYPEAHGEASDLTSLGAFLSLEKA